MRRSVSIRLGLLVPLVITGCHHDPVAPATTGGDRPANATAASPAGATDDELTAIGHPYRGGGFYGHPYAPGEYEDGQFVGDWTPQGITARDAAGSLGPDDNYYYGFHDSSIASRGGSYTGARSGGSYGVVRGGFGETGHGFNGFGGFGEFGG